jgi:hypothetical protein
MLARPLTKPFTRRIDLYLSDTHCISGARRVIPTNPNTRCRHR